MHFIHTHTPTRTHVRTRGRHRAGSLVAFRGQEHDADLPLVAINNGRVSAQAPTAPKRDDYAKILERRVSTLFRDAKTREIHRG